jgi:hypothetical protein
LRRQADRDARRSCLEDHFQKRLDKGALLTKGDATLDREQFARQSLIGGQIITSTRSV